MNILKISHSLVKCLHSLKKLQMLANLLRSKCYDVGGQILMLLQVNIQFLGKRNTFMESFASEK